MSGWRIAGGAVERIELPFPIEGVDRDGAPVILSDGEADANFDTFTLPVLVDIATRLTPWALWYAAPGFGQTASCGGEAWRYSEVAVVSSAHGPERVISAGYHEAWHLADHLMRADLLAELDARLATGPEWPGDYLPRPRERRARAFSSFATMMHEGVRVTVAGPNVPTEIWLFWHVLSGDFGREILTARAPPPPQKSRLRRVVEWF